MVDACTAIILGAGKGTRMKSELPKVLFPVLGRPMIHWVLDALQAAGIQKKIVVVGYRDDLVRSELNGRSGVEFALQAQQLGTGHAVQMCRELLEGVNGPVLIVAGDSPLIQASSISTLLRLFASIRPACLLGTLAKDNPQGLGRIVRDAQRRFLRIVEHKDASPAELGICEVNMSTYLFNAIDLLWALGKLKNVNSQAEYYLTDCPQLLLEAGKLVEAHPVLKACEALSINTIDELAAVESKMQELGYACTS
ncbi:MAG: NTP transferase domain-containing protein [Pirellulaceae bacterium]|nr:NTP transferase domain-containing protein [Pirellulaceae bacterium]